MRYVHTEFQFKISIYDVDNVVSENQNHRYFSKSKRHCSAVNNSTIPILELDLLSLMRHIYTEFNSKCQFVMEIMSRN